MRIWSRHRDQGAAMAPHNRILQIKLCVKENEVANQSWSSHVHWPLTQLQRLALATHAQGARTTQENKEYADHY